MAQNKNIFKSLFFSPGISLLWTSGDWTDVLGTLGWCTFIAPQDTWGDVTFHCRFLAQQKVSLSASKFMFLV